MGFRVSRVQNPPSRLNGEPRGSPFFVGPAGFCRRRSPAARGIPGQIPPSRLVGESALQRISPATNFVVGLFLHLRPPVRASGQRNRARPTASSRVLCATDTRLRVASSYQNATFDSRG